MMNQLSVHFLTDCNLRAIFLRHKNQIQWNTEIGRKKAVHVLDERWKFKSNF